MYNMRFLRFYKSDPKEPSKVYISEGLDILPEELRLFHWIDYPLPYVPLSICASNLVKLVMHNSYLLQLWDEYQLFPKLRSIDVRGCRHLNKLPNLSQTPNIESIYLDDCINLVQIHSSSILRKLSNLSFSRCNKLRSINLAGSIHPRSLKLLIACNYFDFKKLRFRRVTFRFLLSEGGNIYSLRLKVVSVPFTNMRLSSLLPFVGKLRCLNVTTSSSRFEFGSFCKCFTFDHGIHPVHFSPWEAISLELMRTPQTCEVKSSTRKGFMRGSATREEEIGGMKLMDPENSAQLDCDCVIDSMSKLPNSITRWSLLTNLSLQESDMVSVLGNEYLPGLPSLKSLAQSDCSSLQPIMDLTFSVNAKTSIFAIIFSEELNQSESSDALVTNIDEVLNRPERSD
ncbi:disease resistance-like protein DSC1 [Senna tora]|uniref:Disease resistance-like protein DSC1 n=1 Tax=Senna tora TaxID=362788 RepID=A0A834W4T9_9FABA|nr:disease resistance-like protein DSC1 [Senna tora]